MQFKTGKPTFSEILNHFGNFRASAPVLHERGYRMFRNVLVFFLEMA
jgi:hypothetical protein